MCAALTADDLRDGLLLAVNHSSDSDSTGSLCGNLLGTVHGAHALPPPWYVLFLAIRQGCCCEIVQWSHVWSWAILASGSI